MTREQAARWLAVHGPHDHTMDDDWERAYLALGGGAGEASDDIGDDFATRYKGITANASHVQAWLAVMDVLNSVDVAWNSDHKASGVDCAIAAIRNLASERDEALAQLAGVTTQRDEERAALKRCHALLEIANDLFDITDQTEQWHKEAEAELVPCDEGGECPTVTARALPPTVTGGAK